MKKSFLTVILTCALIAVLMIGVGSVSAGAESVDVARVNDKNGVLIGYYTVLDDAIAAAQANESSTITLLADCKPMKSSYLKINYGKFTIDFNGYVLTSNGSNTSILIESPTNIILFDDNDEPGGSDKMITSNKNGNMTINGGIYTDTVRAWGGSLTILGGEFTSQTVLSSGSMTIYGGKFECIRISDENGVTPASVFPSGFSIYTESGDIVPVDSIPKRGIWYEIERASVVCDLGKNGDISLEYASAVYTGNELKPDVTVKVGETELVEGTDYAVSYSNNLNAGTATVTVTGKGRYIGACEKSFTITKKTLSASDFSVTGLNVTYEYNSSHEAVVTPYAGLDADHVNVFYMKNGSPVDGAPRDAGTYSVLVSVKDEPNHEDILIMDEWNLVISPRPVDVEVGTPGAEYFYSGYAHKPVVYISLGLLPAPADEFEGCTVTYENNTQVGTAKVTVGGNYTGEATFTIKKGRPVITAIAPVEMVMPGYVFDLTFRTTAIDNALYSTEFKILAGEGYTFVGNRVTVNDDVAVGSTVVIKFSSSATVNYEAAEGELELTVGVPTFDPSGIESDIDELQSMVSTKADADDIAQKLEEITGKIQALETVKDSYKDADSALKQELEALIADLEGALADLEESLDTSLVQLADRIDDSDADIAGIEEDIAEIVTLIEALEAADVALDACVDSIESELDDAIEALEAADVALDAYVDSIESELDDAIEALEAAIAAGDADISEKLDGLNIALAAAKTALEEADATNKAALVAKIDEGYASLDAAVKAMKKELAGAKAELDAKDTELEKKDAELQTFITVVCVVSGVAFCGSASLAAWMIIDKKKKL